MISVKRLSELVRLVQSNVGAFEALSKCEKLAVSCVLARTDLLERSGVSSIDEAKALLSSRWWKSVMILKRE